MKTDILNAENAIIGACLVDASLWHVVLDKLHRDDLLCEWNQNAYEAARRLESESKKPDAPAIADAGLDREYLFQLMQIACAKSTIDQNIELVRKEARRRELAEIGNTLAEGARKGGEPESLIEEAERQIQALDERDSGQLLNGLDIASSFYEFRDEISGRLVKTGLIAIDETLGGGMLPGGFYILAARPGCGKTALALQIADNVAERGGAVLFVSLEMDVSQLQARRLSRRTGISSTRLLLDENLSTEEWRQVQAANVELSRLPLYANGREGCTVLDVRSMARHVKGLSLIVVDYLGLLRPERSRSSRYEEITAISNSLKTLARSLKTPVLCLAQLNRASEQRADKKPGLADLRDSGAIEQDADAVLLMHRPDMYDDESEHGDLVFVSTQIAKNRHAGTAAFELGLYLSTGRFVPVRKGVRS